VAQWLSSTADVQDECEGAGEDGLNGSEALQRQVLVLDGGRFRRVKRMEATDRLNDSG